MLKQVLALLTIFGAAQLSAIAMKNPNDSDGKIVYKSVPAATDADKKEEEKKKETNTTPAATDADKKEEEKK